MACDGGSFAIGGRTPNASAQSITMFFGWPAWLVGSEFGMKYAVPAVADEVTLRIQVEAFKD